MGTRIGVLCWISAGCGEAPRDTTLDLRDAPRIEGAPMCPWRNAAADAQSWFSGATHSDAEVVILSALRGEFAQRMGRTATADENALYVHRVWKDRHWLGEVCVRRVKGSGGAVELAMGFDVHGRLIGVRVQRSREPQEIEADLNPGWLAQFRDRHARDPLRVGQEISAVPERATFTAQAVADGVRGILVLRELGQLPQALRRPAPEAAIGNLHAPTP